MIPRLVWQSGSLRKHHSGERVAGSPPKRHPRISLAILAASVAGRFARRRDDVSRSFPDVAVKCPPASIPGADRVAKWFAVFCIVAGSAGCVLTQDIPGP